MRCRYDRFSCIVELVVVAWTWGICFQAIESSGFAYGIFFCLIDFRHVRTIICRAWVLVLRFDGETFVDNFGAFSERIPRRFFSILAIHTVTIRPWISFYLLTYIASKPYFLTYNNKLTFLPKPIVNFLLIFSSQKCFK